MQGEVWMRRRQKSEKNRFYCFTEHITKVNEYKDTSVAGWIFKSNIINEDRTEENFIRDEHIDFFKAKTRHILISEEDVAKKLLSGEISAGIL